MISLKYGISNSVGPDETPHYEPSHLDLHCLQKPFIIANGSEIVTTSITTAADVQHSDFRMYFSE